LVLTLCNPATLTAHPLSLPAFVGAVCGVCWGEFVTVLAVRLSALLFPLHYRRAVKVFFVRHWLKVRRIYARPVPAQVIEVKSTRNRPPQQHVAESMGQPPLTATGIGRSLLKDPVALEAKRPPLPAFVWSLAVNLCPKAFLKRADNAARRVSNRGVTISVPPTIVHGAPPTFFGCLVTAFNRAFHIRSVPVVP
jgi:hypothetical protein